MDPRDTAPHPAAADQAMPGSTRARRDPTEAPPDPGVPLHVTVEALAWVTRFLGGDGGGQVVFKEAVPPGATVREVLHQVSGRFPELDAALWDRVSGELGEHIEVLVNDAILGVAHSLDSALRDGDRITLLGQYMGG
ncbi:MAG: MoaD/ThiS family protein [Deltaproteobacteria bacterium]|nr:MoaD/ThiS family protein [Deltaproteobacteria bacterium]